MRTGSDGCDPPSDGTMVHRDVYITDWCPDGDQYVARYCELPALRAPNPRDWVEPLKIYLALKEG